VADPPREREPAVTTECPDLPRSACDSSNCRKEEQQDEQASKDTCCRARVSRIVYDVDDREVTTIEVIFEVRDAETTHVSTRVLISKYHVMRNVAASSITCKSYQNVIIIVMPMMPLANVAHLTNISQCAYNATASQNLQHCFRQSDRGIFQLFRHVCSSIRANEAPNRRCQPDQA
jgi:hypothetical protein